MIWKTMLVVGALALSAAGCKTLASDSQPATPATPPGATEPAASEKSEPEPPKSEPQKREPAAAEDETEARSGSEQEKGRDPGESVEPKTE